MAMIAGGIHDDSHGWGGTVSVAEFLTSLRSKKRKGMRRRHSAEVLNDGRYKRKKRGGKGQRASVAGVLQAMKRSNSGLGSKGSIRRSTSHGMGTANTSQSTGSSQLRSSGAALSSRASKKTYDGQSSARVPFSGLESGSRASAVRAHVSGTISAIDASADAPPSKEAGATRLSHESSSHETADAVAAGLLAPQLAGSTKQSGRMRPPVGLRASSGGQSTTTAFYGDNSEVAHIDVIGGASAPANTSGRGLMDPPDPRTSTASSVPLDKGDIDAVHQSILRFNLAQEAKQQAEYRDEQERLWARRRDVVVQLTGCRREMSIWVDENLRSWKAKLFSAVVQLLILINVLAIILETEKSVADAAPDGFFSVLDATCSALFTVEIVVRVWASESLLSYIREPMNCIDVVSVIPFYVGLALSLAESQGGQDGGDAVDSLLQALQLVRIVRVTRVFKLSRYFSAGYEFVRLLSTAGSSLLVMLFFILVTLTVAGSALLYTEELAGRIRDPGTVLGPNYDQTFSSIPGAVYFALTTMAQVGYGDAIPATIAGRLIAILVSFSGFVLFALSVTVISQHYHHMKRTDAMVQEMEEKESAVREVKQRFGIKRAISAEYAEGAKDSTTRGLAEYLRQMGIERALDIESDLDEEELTEAGSSQYSEGYLVSHAKYDLGEDEMPVVPVAGVADPSIDDGAPNGEVVDKEAERARRDEERYALERFPFALTTAGAMDRFALSNDCVDFIATRVKKDYRDFYGETAEWWDYSMDAEYGGELDEAAGFTSSGGINTSGMHSGDVEENDTFRDTGGGSSLASPALVAARVGSAAGIGRGLAAGMGGGTGGGLGVAGGFETEAATTEDQERKVPARPARPRLSRAAYRRRASLAGVERAQSNSAEMSSGRMVLGQSRRASSQGYSLRGSTNTSSNSSKRSSKASSKHDTDDGAQTMSAGSPSGGSAQNFGGGSSRVLVPSMHSDGAKATTDDEMMESRADTKPSTSSSGSHSYDIFSGGAAARSRSRGRKRSSSRNPRLRLARIVRSSKESGALTSTRGGKDDGRSELKKHFMEPDVSIRPDFAATLRIEWYRARRANAIRRFEERASQLKSIAGLMQQIAHKTQSVGKETYERDFSGDIDGGEISDRYSKRRGRRKTSIREQFVGLGGFTRQLAESYDGIDSPRVGKTGKHFPTTSDDAAAEGAVVSMTSSSRGEKRAKERRADKARFESRRRRTRRASIGVSTARTRHALLLPSPTEANREIAMSDLLAGGSVGEGTSKRSSLHRSGIKSAAGDAATPDLPVTKADLRAPEALPSQEPSKSPIGPPPRRKQRRRGRRMSIQLGDVSLLRKLERQAQDIAERTARVRSILAEQQAADDEVDGMAFAMLAAPSPAGGNKKGAATPGSAKARRNSFLVPGAKGDAATEARILHKRLSDAAEAKKEIEKEKKRKRREKAKATLAKLQGVKKLKKASQKALSALRLTGKLKLGTGGQPKGASKVASLFGALKAAKAAEDGGGEVPDGVHQKAAQGPLGLLAAAQTTIKYVIAADPRRGESSVVPGLGKADESLKGVSPGQLRARLTAECLSGKISEDDLADCLERIETSYLQWESKVDSMLEVVQTVFVSCCQQLNIKVPETMLKEVGSRMNENLYGVSTGQAARKPTHAGAGLRGYPLRDSPAIGKRSLQLPAGSGTPGGSSKRHLSRHALAAMQRAYAAGSGTSGMYRGKSMNLERLRAGGRIIGRPISRLGDGEAPKPTVLQTKPHSTQAARIGRRSFFASKASGTGSEEQSGDRSPYRSGSYSSGHPRRPSVASSSGRERRVRRVSVAVHEMRRRQSITRQRSAEPGTPTRLVTGGPLGGDSPAGLSRRGGRGAQQGLQRAHTVGVQSTTYAGGPV